MRRCALLLSVLIASIGLQAQDVRCAYKLSTISAFISLSKITESTAEELADTMQAIVGRHHSPDFVIDLLHCEGDFGEGAKRVAEVLAENSQRLAFLIGIDSGHAAEQVAVGLRYDKRAIILADTEGTRLTADIELKAYNDYKNDWYNSLIAENIIPLTAERYAKENPDRTALYPTAEKMLVNFDENALIMETLHKVAGEHGIERNDEAFYYSGYILLAELRAALIAHCFPEARQQFHRARNVQIDSAIGIALKVLESGEYRELLGEKQ